MRIAGYTFQADIVCPACIVDFYPDARTKAVIHDGAASSWDAEAVLDTAAVAAGINRGDEYSFDSGDFPKVIFAHDTTDETCGECGEAL
jgi:hypothetical protein